MAFIKFKPLISRLNFKGELKPEEITGDIKQYLVEDEKIVIAYKAYRDICIFTNKRVMIVDLKGIRGFRKTIFSIKYDSISSYSLNIRHIDSIIDITTDSGYKISLNFMKPIPLDDMFVVYRFIADRVLNKVMQ